VLFNIDFWRFDMTPYKAAQIGFVVFAFGGAALAATAHIKHPASSASNASAAKQSGAMVVCGRSKFKKPQRTGRRKCVEFGAPAPSSAK
jgi:hypothetical protein